MNPTTEALFLASLQEAHRQLRDLQARTANLESHTTALLAVVEPYNGTGLAAPPAVAPTTPPAAPELE